MIEYLISFAMIVFLFYSVGFLISHLRVILKRFILESIYIGLYKMKNIDRSQFISKFLSESKKPFDSVFLFKSENSFESYLLSINKNIIKYFIEDFLENKFIFIMMIALLILTSLLVHESIISNGLIYTILSVFVPFLIFFLFMVFTINKEVNCNKQKLREQTVRFKKDKGF